MTTSTLSWKQGLDVAPAVAVTGQAPVPTPVMQNGRSKRATRRLGGAMLAALAAAVMVGASSLLAGEGQSGGALTWLALWIVGFATLLIFARAAFATAGVLQARWALYQENARWDREQRQLQRAARLDPRLQRELQIMADRATWRAN